MTVAAIRLLLVDDEPSIREPLTDYLVAHGFAVDAVADAAAFACLRRGTAVHHDPMATIENRLK